MPYVNGLVSVPNSATFLCTVGEQGALVQNLGSVVVTLGGAGVVAGQGVSLAASQTSPVFVPGGQASASFVPGTGAVVSSENLYAIGASAGPTNVVFTLPQ